MAIEENFLIEKRNILNELRSNNMTLQELRFFSIYLSKINARDLSTRQVRFSLEDFEKIMDLDKPKISYLKSVANNLLCKIVNIPKENGGFIAFQLFKECSLDIDDNNNWYIEIDAHDKALPLMFEFKEKYFSYQLWNALRLRSANQLRMYELLKQYEKIGERTISIDLLKELLGISKDEYKLFNNFKKDVLEVCKKSIEENTDIKFTYEPTGKKGIRGKIINLRFKIYKNKNYKDPLSLNEFIEQNTIQPQEIIQAEEENTSLKETIALLSSACNDEFSEIQIKLLCEYIFIIVQVPLNYQCIELERYHYLAKKYAELNWRANQTKVNNRFGYLKKIIEVDIDN